MDIDIPYIYCVFCKQSGYLEYFGHDKNNCLRLMSLAPCRNCGASGRFNHTLSNTKCLYAIFHHGKCTIENLNCLLNKQGNDFQIKDFTLEITDLSHSDEQSACDRHCPHKPRIHLQLRRSPHAAMPFNVGTPPTPLSLINGQPKVGQYTGATPTKSDSTAAMMPHCSSMYTPPGLIPNTMANSGFLNPYQATMSSTGNRYPPSSPAGYSANVMTPSSSIHNSPAPMISPSPSYHSPSRMISPSSPGFSIFTSPKQVPQTTPTPHQSMPPKSKRCLNFDH